MKDTKGKSQYRRYRENRIYQSASDDRVLILAKELVHAKDKWAMNLFWDSDEEEFMRTYLDDTEEYTC